MNLGSRSTTGKSALEDLLLRGNLDLEVVGKVRPPPPSFGIFFYQYHPLLVFLPAPPNRKETVSRKNTPKHLKTP